MRRFVLILAAVSSSGCSLLVHFDPESQPCDSAGECLAGYLCSDAGLCKATDGGTDGGGSDGSACVTRETACGDRLDNDCDGQTDCADSDCGGVACDDRDACTTGETCSGGSCPRGSPVVCTSTNPCQTAAGSCEAGTGRCIFASLADGTACGAGQAARCCAGTCINTTINTTNCGGCGLACATGQSCQSIDQSGCIATEPMNTSGRCTCATGVPCPGGQTCTNGRCVPQAATQCAPGQSLADAGLCTGYCRY